MTRVGFYVLQSTAPEARLEVAMRLTEKAFQQGHRVYINAANEAQATQLDEKLWHLRPASFLPHALQSDNTQEDIAIGWGQEPSIQNGLLIHLQYSVPPFFSRFERVAEVVTQDAASLSALRESWQFYRQRGYQLEKHDL